MRIRGRGVGGANPSDVKKVDPTPTVRQLAERFLEVHIAKRRRVPCRRTARYRTADSTGSWRPLWP
jgi:hypothetical protein